MKALGILVFSLACNHDDCVLADAPALAGGTGSIATDAATSAMDGFEWTEPTAPTLTHSVSFGFSFGNGLHVDCDRIPWSAVAGGVTIDVSQSCVVIVGSTGAEAQLAAATLSATSTIDASNEGTLTLRFDVPAADVTLVDDQNVETAAHVEVSGAVGTVSFAHASCPSAGCGGINLSNV
jgi:hypothetical protein